MTERKKFRAHGPTSTCSEEFEHLSYDCSETSSLLPGNQFPHIGRKSSLDLLTQGHMWHLRCHERPELFQASLHYNDAILGAHYLRPPLRTDTQRSMYRLNRNMRFSESTSIFVLIVLGFFERPWWCQHNGFCALATYPTFFNGDWFISFSWTMLIEVICLFILLLRFLVEKEYLGEQFWKGRWTLVYPLWVKNVVVWFYLIDSFVSSQWTLHNFGIRAAPYCRVILFVCTYRPLWELLAIMLKSVPEVFDLGIIIAIYICMSAWLAVAIFDQGLEHIKFVSSYLELVWELMVVLSDNLFPAIMIPAYNDDRTTVLFWIAYIVVGYFIIMHLTFGVLFNSFRVHYESVKTRRQRKTALSLEDAFRVLDVNRRNWLSPDEVVEFLQFEIGSGMMSDQKGSQAGGRAESNSAMLNQVISFTMTYNSEKSGDHGDGADITTNSDTTKKEKLSASTSRASNTTGTQMDVGCYKQFMLHIMSTVVQDEKTWFHYMFPRIYYSRKFQQFDHFVSKRKIRFNSHDDGYLLFEVIIDTLLAFNFLLLISGQVD